MANDYAVDEDVWSAYPFWKFHEIDHLIIDIDPDKIEGQFNFEYSQEHRKIRKKVQRVLERWRREDCIGRGIEPIKIVEALEKHGFKFPERLANAVKLKAQKDSTDQGPQSVSVSSSRGNETVGGLKKSQQTLRRLLLAIAIDKYRFDPGAKKHSATGNIAAATQRVGLPIHKDTILKHLKLAIEELDDAGRGKF